jgi:hypothetical protein
VTSQFNLRPLTIVAIVIVCSATAMRAQGPFGRVPDLLGGAGLRGFGAGASPVTTSLDNALTAVEYLDHYAPSGPMRLESQPQDETGAFHLGPGAYEFVAQSFCLHAGTHGPGGGDGYVYAPLEGTSASSIRHILQRASAHREIAQKDVQVLVWAILARTPINRMSRESQATAARLLNPAELAELSAGSIGVMTPGNWRGTAPLVAPAMARVFQAESSLREMLTGGNAAFADLERVAVLLGNPEPDPNSRAIPRGRWSYHPGGYFIRFFPSGYNKTELQVVVPEPMTIERDGAGRITGLTDSRGARIEVGDQVRFRPSGFPAASGREDAAGWEQIDVRHRSSDHDRNAILQEAAAWQSVLSRPAPGATARSMVDVRDLVDLAQLQLGLRQALRAAGREDRPRMTGATELVARAWATAFCEQAGGCVRKIQRLDAGVDATTRPEGFRFASRAAAPEEYATGDRGGFVAAGSMSSTTSVDLSEAVAVPGERGRQRLGLSARAAR